MNALLSRHSMNQGQLSFIAFVFSGGYIYVVIMLKVEIYTITLHYPFHPSDDNSIFIPVPTVVSIQINNIIQFVYI
jgi:hypothetical protein